MHLLKNYYENVVKYDLINKFLIDKIQNFPKFQKIILTLNFKKYDYDLLLSGLAALELLTSQKIILLNARSSNVLLKVRKGHIIGCKVTLRKKNMFFFFFTLTTENFSKSTFFVNSKTRQNKHNNSFILGFKNVFRFTVLEKHFLHFKNIPFLSMTLKTSSKNLNELIFLLKTFKTPLQIFGL